MANIYRTFATDKTLEAKGFMVEYDDIRFLVARAGGANSKFRKVFQAKAKPHRFKIDNDMLSEELATKMMAEAYAEAIILRADSKGVDGKWVTGKIPKPDGTLIDATPEALTELFIALPLLFSDVQSMANNVGNFRKAEEETDAKN